MKWNVTKGQAILCINNCLALSWCFRILGVFPLIFFLLNVYNHIKNGTPEYILWMCNISVAALGIGILFNLPIIIRTSTIWLIPGLPLWILFDIAQHKIAPIATFLVHIGGLIIGLVAINKVRATPKDWIPAVIWALVIQQITRLTTAPKLNVNVAHNVYPKLSIIFPYYWQFWIVLMIAVAFSLKGITQLLCKFFSPFNTNQIAKN